jgi:hypothetical protein
MSLENSANSYRIRRYKWRSKSHSTTGFSMASLGFLHLFEDAGTIIEGGAKQIMTLPPPEVVPTSPYHSGAADKPVAFSPWSFTRIDRFMPVDSLHACRHDVDVCLPFSVAQSDESNVPFSQLL